MNSNRLNVVDNNILRTNEYHKVIALTSTIEKLEGENKTLRTQVCMHEFIEAEWERGRATIDILNGEIDKLNGKIYSMRSEVVALKDHIVMQRGITSEVSAMLAKVLSSIFPTTFESKREEKTAINLGKFLIL